MSRWEKVGGLLLGTSIGILRGGGISSARVMVLVDDMLKRTELFFEGIEELQGRGPIGAGSPRRRHARPEERN